MRKNFTKYKQKASSFQHLKWGAVIGLIFILFSAGSFVAQGGDVLKENTLTMCRSHLVPVDLNSVIEVAIPAGSGTWYNDSNTMPVSNIFVPEPDQDSYSFYFQVESKAALCELEVGQRYRVNILINDIPTPEGESQQIFCYNPDEELTLKDIAVTGENIIWYDTPLAGVQLLPETLLEDGKTYYATQVEPGCGESTNRLEVNVILDTVPELLITNPGPQPSSFDLNELLITDKNNVDGEITFHSQMPVDGTDMSFELENTILTFTRPIFVMKVTANGCNDIEKVFIEIDSCNYEIVADVLNVECFGDNSGSISLDVISHSSKDTQFSYLWSNGEATSAIEGLTAGKYSVVITSDNSCDAIIDTFYIYEPNILEVVTEVLGESAANAKDGKAIAKVAGGTPEYTYIWNDNLQQTTATATNLGGGEYKVKVTDANGCQVEGIAILEGKLFIPDGFSPNGDGINDYFEISGLEDYPEARIEIYNRWNSLVYSKDGYGNETRWGTADAWWNGRSNHKMTVGSDLLPAATYIYILRLRPDKPDVHKGTIFINR
ncbi:MAG: gliding motility-associated C-terminal domain-containing protein [Draconibacterium sp.]